MGMLDGFVFVEASGHGPVPFCGMVLQDMGARIMRIGAPNADPIPGRSDFLNHGKTVLPLDLKSEAGKAAFLHHIAGADGLIEGFRPGVMERLGLGPERCLEVNPRLIYARMTGYGQAGPLATVPGHDINFIALSGILHAVGPKDGAPIPPLNIGGDFGGGAMFLAAGILGAALERQRTGRGRVVEVAMAQAAAKLIASLYGRFVTDPDQNVRGINIVDGGAPFYSTYEAADGKYVAVGALEDRFFAVLADALDIPAELRENRMDKRYWPRLRSHMAEAFRMRSRDEWCSLLEGADACLSPVLDLAEAPRHPQHEALGSFSFEDGHARPDAVVK